MKRNSVPMTAAKMINLLLAIVLVLTLFVGCGSPQKNAEKQYGDVISISLTEVTGGVAYYDVSVASSFGWDDAKIEAQCALAKMTVDDCVRQAEFEDAVIVNVLARVSGNWNNAFYWDGGDTVKIYTNEGHQSEEYEFSVILD
jgi:hypothetical protein